MSFVKWLSRLGADSGKVYPADLIMNLCPEDGRPVEMVLDLERLQSERPDMSWYHPERKDMWRFGALLPLDIDDPHDRQHIVSLGEGCTPLLELSEYSLARNVGFTLSLKEEGRSVQGFGANPTKSFKDRGMAVTVSMAKRFGMKRLAIPTQGNAGDSLARYGLKALLEVMVVLPQDTPTPILKNIRETARQSEAIQFEFVQGTIREAGALVREKYIPRGFFNVATFQEPGWRIEGKKTLGLEIAEPSARKPDWSLPDVIVYPCGGGTGMVGMWKAFYELETLGLIDSKRPRMIAVQSAVTAPLVRAFESKSEDSNRLTLAGQTIATGLNVPYGVGHFRVLEILKESKGAAVAVTENQIRCQLDASETESLKLSPEGAAVMAAFPALVDRELITPKDSVVVFNTGSPDKYF